MSVPHFDVMLPHSPKMTTAITPDPCGMAAPEKGFMGCPTTACPVGMLQYHSKNHSGNYIPAPREGGGRRCGQVGGRAGVLLRNPKAKAALPARATRHGGLEQRWPRTLTLSKERVWGQAGPHGTPWRASWYRQDTASQGPENYPNPPPTTQQFSQKIQYFSAPWQASW